MNSRQPISGWRFLDEGKNEAACKQFEEYIVEHPEDSSSYVGLGKALGRLDKNAAALDAFRTAIHLDPENSEAHYGIGATYSHMGLPVDALEAFKEVIRNDPENPDAHYGAAWCYCEIKEREKAAFHARKAATLAPNAANNHLMAAKCIPNRDLETILWHLETANRLDRRSVRGRWRWALWYLRIFAGVGYSLQKVLEIWALIAAVYATSLSAADLQRWLWIATLPFLGVSGYNLVKRRYYRTIWALGLGLVWVITMYLLFVAGKG